MRSSLKLDGKHYPAFFLNNKDLQSRQFKFVLQWRPDKNLSDLSKQATIAYNYEKHKGNIVFDCYYLS